MEVEEDMRCPKCSNLMLSERFIDYQQSKEPTFHGFRCLSCGLILDTVILLHRTQQQQENAPDRPREIFAGINE